MNFANALASSAESVFPLLRSVLPGFANSPADELIHSARDGVRVVGHHRWPTDSSFQAAWTDLIARVPGAAVFQTGCWQQAVTAWPQRLDRLLLLAVWRGSELIGALPLQTHRGGIAESAGAVASDYLDPVIDPNYQEQAWRAIFNYFRRSPKPIQEVTLHNIRPTADCLAILPRLANEEGFAFSDEETGSSCFLNLPKTWDQYLAQMKAGDRKELRRKISKAQTQANAILEPDTDAQGNIERANHVLNLVEAAGGKRGVKCRWLLRRQFNAAAPALAEQNVLRVFSMKLHDQPAAGIITFRTPHGVMGWATAYREADRQLSPGIVMFSLAIQRLIEEGMNQFDLLRGDADYKLRLGADVRPLRQITLRQVV